MIAAKLVIGKGFEFVSISTPFLGGVGGG